jgi:pimeloyl-ACP methyl ester carboxylesterase
MRKKTGFALFACIALLSFVPLYAQDTELAPQDRYFDSNGVKIRYIVKGEGEPIVLTHGFTMDALAEWGSRGIIDPLAERYKVIAIDNRGHGKSGKPHEPEKYGMEMVKDIVRLLDHLGMNKAHVAGYSLGGFITTKLITTYPDRVQSAIIGGAGWWKEFGSQESLWLKLADSLEQGKGVGSMIEFMIPEGRPKPTQEQIDALDALIAARNDTLALAAVIRGMGEIQVTEHQLRANTVPALAIIGEIDTLKPGVDEMSAVMANLEVVVVEGADHPGAIASPKFRESMLDFLPRHPMSIPAEPATIGNE